MLKMSQIHSTQNITNEVHLILAQGVLPFKYEAEKSCTGMTGLAGLPIYLELMRVAGVAEAVDQHVQGRASAQGWTDRQMIMALLLLNLVGGDCIDDLAKLEKDDGFASVARQVETHGMPRQQRRVLQRRWRKERTRSVPSPSSAFRYLEGFHDAAEEKRRANSPKAFIPQPNEALRGLNQVNRAFVAFVQSRSSQKIATLDQDATLVETHKKEALWCYKHFKAYQPLNTYWAEQDLILHSEFRDGNVPAGHEQLRVLKAALDNLPAGVEKVFLRSDTAGYQQDLLKYCAEGHHERFGVIEFAVGSNVTPEFKAAVAELAESDWQPLYRAVEVILSDGSKASARMKTHQEWAEVCYVPHWVGHKKSGADYRFIAVREALQQLELPTVEQQSLPFPTMEFGSKGHHKLFGLITNSLRPGDELIWWLRARCGKSEEVHAVQKDDLAGGQMPSGKFGINAAWWAIMVLAYNLHSAMKNLVLGGDWVRKRLKAIRFWVIGLPGRVVRKARQLFIRLTHGHPSNSLLLEARRTILLLARGYG